MMRMNEADATWRSELHPRKRRKRSKRRKRRKRRVKQSKSPRSWTEREEEEMCQKEGSCRKQADVPWFWVSASDPCPFFSFLAVAATCKRT